MNNDPDATTTRLMLAYLCVANEGEANLARKVQILDRFDLPDEEIARVCGVAVGSVRNARLTGKKKPGSGKAKAPAQVQTPDTAPAG